MNMRASRPGTAPYHCAPDRPTTRSFWYAGCTSTRSATPTKGQSRPAIHLIGACVVMLRFMPRHTRVREVLVRLVRFLRHLHRAWRHVGAARTNADAARGFAIKRRALRQALGNAHQRQCAQGHAVLCQPALRAEGSRSGLESGLGSRTTDR